MSLDEEDEAPDVNATDDASQLLAFVRDRDTACPGCGYNLRALSKPVCPECRRELRLTVGFVEQRIGWLFATLAPCVFSGICAFLIAVPMVVVPLTVRNVNPPPPGVFALDGFGWLSAAFGIGLWLRRRLFLRSRTSVQIAWAFGVWLVHLAAFAVLAAAIL